MKIVNSNSVFVQKKDLDYLIHKNLALPESVILRILSDIKIDENNKYEFVKFTNRKEIKYFKKLDWIIDYNQINKLSEDEMVNMCKETAEEIDKITDEFNALPNNEKLQNYDMLTKCSLLDYKMHSIRDALWFKQGHINMEIPKTNYKQLLKKFTKKKTP